MGLDSEAGKKDATSGSRYTAARCGQSWARSGPQGASQPRALPRRPQDQARQPDSQVQRKEI